MTLECLRQRARQSDPKHEENRVGWALKAVQNGFEMFLSRSSNDTLCVANVSVRISVYANSCSSHEGVLNM